MEEKGERSDWGEIAKGGAGGDGIRLPDRARDAAVRREARGFDGPAWAVAPGEGVWRVWRKFFGRLTCEFLNYFLSKTLGTEVGEGHRFVTTNQVAQFKDGMRKHCEEASLIVESFCGEWLSKHRFEEKGNISRESSEGFGWNAIRKIQLELAERNTLDGN